ncbi:hypothetical protein [Hymenobacter defluvii]|uniref:RHS repeat protein n=1 Tax=Hymenobacter defluvii TaxID=2054411 RepID=A0ABS3TFB3_9BACT|nr:hypothetical protein [Hymenobacter defluvii]MBO3272350.1 hypothetical protein [Hymenobacter defluvii]
MPVTDGARCEVYQFAGTDSAARELVLVRTLSPSGQVLQERATNYQETCGDNCVDGTTRYQYQDTMLVARVFTYTTYKKGDQAKTLYYHDQQRRLVRQEHFTYERRLRQDVAKGIGGRDGCIVGEADYEQHRTWEKTSSIQYAYDAKERRVSYDAPALHFSRQNRYTWAYDSLDRVQTYYSYDGQRLIWVERYTYSPAGYRFTRTWYNADGTPAHITPQQQEYGAPYTFTRYQSRNGQVER